MAWNDGLLPEQEMAAGHHGNHARLLAGPGTGKTKSLTQHICFLIEERNIDPTLILALTFTRAAAYELRQRVEAEVGTDRMPRISTLHSFALRQLLRNLGRLNALPLPLRIADDWEERYIIIEDFKALLSLDHVKYAQRKFIDLSADWQDLTADENDWELRFPDPAFIGAWQEHRTIYGYVLRSELVYQLKRALEQIDDFIIEGPPTHVLVDEYQDLNRCDLAVIRSLADRLAEIYVAGDDDQSIYGFRKAHPEGIRRFPDEYNETTCLSLQTCMRCDRSILDIGLFVAKQDYTRLDKPLQCADGQAVGEVALLRFTDQNEEAHGIALLCKNLIQSHGLEPSDVLILLRSDRRGKFSSVIMKVLDAEAVPVNVSTEEEDPLSQTPGRKVLAFLRLLANNEDHLAWRTLLQLRRNNIGPAGIFAVYQLAKTNNSGFAQTLQAISNDPNIVAAPHGVKLKSEIDAIREILDVCRPEIDTEHILEKEQIAATVLEVIDCVIDDNENETKDKIFWEIGAVIDTDEPESFSGLVRVLENSNDNIEQELETGKVNILSMHKAKGLTAEAVIIAAAEDEYIPGKAEADVQLGDERRLLYVSLTRAKHHLFITYCQSRRGPQRHTGRTSGQIPRTLTRFLRDGPITPQQGTMYVDQL